MSEEITPETEVSKAAMIARKYLDGETVYLVHTVPNLIEAIRLAYRALGNVETQFFWNSPLGKQLYTVKEAYETMIQNDPEVMAEK